MQRMCIHAGAKRVPYSAVEAVKDVEGTKSWCPMHHTEVLQVVKDAIPKFGFNLIGEEHALRNNGMQYFGLLTVEEAVPGDPRAGGLAVPGVALQIGVRNSLNKTLAGALVAGTKVFVCNNLSFKGEVAMTRKHTPNIRKDIGDKIGSAFVKLLNLFGRQKAEIEEMQVREVSEAEVNTMIVEGLRRGILPPSKFRDLEAQLFGKFDDPTRCGGVTEPTAWRVFNAFTQCLKDSHPDVIAQRTGKLFDLCRVNNVVTA